MNTASSSITMSEICLKNLKRNHVQASYETAKFENEIRYNEKNDVKATSEYIYKNQIEDATYIVNTIFYKNNKRVVSVIKKTKIGADGLMIQIIKSICTHDDDNFVVDPNNVRIITGMSNKDWERDMIEKSPSFIKDKIYHHGQLKNAKIEKNMKNGLIIIDEIDVADKEGLKLHDILKNAKWLDIQNITENNNRVIFISATMIKELYELHRWGDYHEKYNMTIPKNYISHYDFLTEFNIIKDWYPLKTEDSIRKWIKEDILEMYENDYRVHIVRTDRDQSILFEKICKEIGVDFKLHDSENRLTGEELTDCFINPLSNHIVLCIKGFFRRANLIPNQWKIKIGALHEKYTKKVDNNVQIQGLIGRMTGYWKDIIQQGHKTGPYRTSKKAIIEYENAYENPFGNNSYSTNGFSKNKNGHVTATIPTMLHPQNIEGLNPVDLPDPLDNYVRNHKFFETIDDMMKFICEDEKINPRARKPEFPKDDDGFELCTVSSGHKRHSIEEIIELANSKNKFSNMPEPNHNELKNIGDCTLRKYVCYKDINDITTKKYIVIWVKKIQ